MISNAVKKGISFNRNKNMCHNRISAAIQIRPYFESKFEHDAQNQILKLLNQSEGQNILSKFSISKINLNKLIKFKKENGPFTSLDDPLPFLGPQPLEKFYKSILKGEISASPRSSNSMLPRLSAEAQASARKVLSVCFVGNRVSWSLVTKSKKIEGSDPELQLDALVLHEIDFKPKTHFLSVLQMMKDVVQDIPPSDIYVFEEGSNVVPTAYLFNFAIQKAQIRSFAMGLLASRENSQIISIKSVAIARMFKLHVGSEKVSGQTIAENTINNQTGFKVKEDLRWNYFSANAEDREHLANSLLLNIAYWKLTNQYMRELKL